MILTIENVNHILSLLRRITHEYGELTPEEIELKLDLIEYLMELKND